MYHIVSYVVPCNPRQYPIGTGPSTSKKARQTITNYLFTLFKSILFISHTHRVHYSGEIRDYTKETIIV